MANAQPLPGHVAQPRHAPRHLLMIVLMGHVWCGQPLMAVLQVAPAVICAMPVNANKSIGQLYAIKHRAQLVKSAIVRASVWQMLRFINARRIAIVNNQLDQMPSAMPMAIVHVIMVSLNTKTPPVSEELFIRPGAVARQLMPAFTTH